MIRFASVEVTYVVTVRYRALRQPSSGQVRSRADRDGRCLRESNDRGSTRAGSDLRRLDLVLGTWCVLSAITLERRSE
ncbi:hypothetical protein GCM10010915_29580 [Microbacterium faecale]|uniref:Uncharacterized protein n=1 Tax=Microbacterium faecale TaxID=1804630 RepID=A0A917DLB0_9MICO|nr:hypothetical protein GCM10010915_29580 [Microbacterium faecale]